MAACSAFLATVAFLEAVVITSGSLLNEEIWDPNLQPVADTPAGVCPLENIGNHPWIIRFMYDMGNQSEELTMMHGVLVSAMNVLTTSAYYESMSTAIVTRGNLKQVLLMTGYNQARNCKQTRHAKAGVWHMDAASGKIGGLGDFGLYTPWQPFLVQGEPFLLNNKAHTFSRIDSALTEVIENPNKPFMMYMYLFKYDVAGKDVKNQSMVVIVPIRFVSLLDCKKMPNFAKQENVEFSEEANATSFFCGYGVGSYGVPGVYNRSTLGQIHGRTNRDGYAGAVAMLLGDDQKEIPLGMYDYAMGTVGEPTRFFITFSSSFFSWFNDVKFSENPSSLEQNSKHKKRPTGPGIFKKHPSIGPPSRNRKSKNGSTEEDISERAIDLNCAFHKQPSNVFGVVPAVFFVISRRRMNGI